MAIHLSHHDEIALITLDRPEALNALSFGQLHDLNRESRATEMILTGRPLDAQEAARIGLVNRLVDGDLIETGIAFAREMTGFSLPVLGLARDAIRRALDLPLPEGLKIEADLSTLAFQTADSVEGMTAFIEKRKPVFRDG